jgi:drug/metabolite transporter (DMT)-like permease
MAESLHRDPAPASASNAGHSPPLGYKPMGAMEWSLLLLLALLWGGSYFWSGLALRELPPFTMVAIRLVMGAILLAVYVRMHGHSLALPLRLWRDVFIMGFLNNVFPFCLIASGQIQIASGLAAILNATAPLFAVVVAHFVTRDEKLTVQKFTGVLLGIAGVSVMIGVDALRGLGLEVLAQLAVVGAAMSYGMAAVFGRRFRNQSAMVIATGQIATAALMSLPLALIIDKPWTLAMPGALTITALFGLGILSTFVSPLLYFNLLKSAGTTGAIIVTFLVPVSALLLGVIILGEAFTAQQAGGMLLIGLGLAAIDGRLGRSLRSRLF